MLGQRQSEPDHPAAPVPLLEVRGWRRLPGRVHRPEEARAEAYIIIIIIIIIVVITIIIIIIIINDIIIFIIITIILIITIIMPGQRHILYITGRTLRDAARSPYIEGLRKEGCPPME